MIVWETPKRCFLQLSNIEKKVQSTVYLQVHIFDCQLSLGLGLLFVKIKNKKITLVYVFFLCPVLGYFTVIGLFI